MARLTFISLHDTNAEGLRELCALLRRHGHQPSLIFLKRPVSAGTARPDDWAGYDERGRLFRYCRGSAVSAREMRLLLGLLRELRPQAVGFSVTAPLRAVNARVAATVRRTLRVPVIWGGADPTVNPAACLPHCDFICRGEGEGAIVEIAARLDRHEPLTAVPNLGWRAGGRLHLNPLAPLITALDELPFKDVTPADKYLIEHNALQRHFPEISYNHQDGRYHIITARGCPYNCSYCCEHAVKKLYAPQPFLRRRSPASVIAELQAARNIIAMRIVQFEDEVFTLDPAWLREFVRRYRREIDLPFTCYTYARPGIAPLLRQLRAAGLVDVCLGLQSGSARIHRDIFGRPFDRDVYLRTAHLLRHYGIRFYADVITGNPYESVADLDATLSVLAALPKPFHMCVNRLYLIPGTQLAARARRLTKKHLPDRVFSDYARRFWLAARHRMFFVSGERAGREQWRLCKRVATPRGSRALRLLTFAPAAVPATHEERRQLAFAIDDYACGRRCFVKLTPARRILAKQLARNLKTRYPQIFRQE